MNSITKGIIGAVIGNILAGPLGAILGFGIAMVLGSSEKSKENRRIEEEERHGAPFNDYGVRLLFQCLGKLAKSDGRVSEDEAEFVRSLMRSWDMNAAMQRRMAQEFNIGRDSHVPFSYLVRELALTMDSMSSSLHDRRVIVQVFCALVAADREVHPAERKMLEDAGRILGVEGYAETFFRDYREQTQQATFTDSLEECYALLGIPSSATNAEVKAAFRRKAKQFHPDIAEAADLDAAAIQRAKEKFQQINNAYETIREQRGMK